MPKVRKISSFSLAQADLKRLGPYFYILYIRVRPSYGPDIRAGLLLQDVGRIEHVIFYLLEKNYVSTCETYFFLEVTQKEVEPLHISYTIVVRGDVVFRFLAIGLHHFPSLWCG